MLICAPVFTFATAFAFMCACSENNLNANAITTLNNFHQSECFNEFRFHTPLLLFKLISLFSLLQSTCAYEYIKVFDSASLICCHFLLQYKARVCHSKILIESTIWEIPSRNCNFNFIISHKKSR